MEAARQTSEASTPGILTTIGSTIGLAFGPSVIAVLTVAGYYLPIEKELGWSRAQVALAFSIVAYMIVIMSPLQGFFVDRFGPRKVLLTSIPLFGLSIGALYFAPANLPLFYLMWAIVPVAGLGLWPLGYLQAITPWFDRKLGLALGCANAGIGLGSTLLPMLVISPIIATHPDGGWRLALLTLGALIIFVSWPVVAFCVREPTATNMAAAKHRGQATRFGTSLQQAMREPTFIVLNIAFFALGLTATSLSSQQVPLLREAGWTPAEATQLQTLFGFGLLVARIVVGYVIDHVFAPRVMMTVSIGGAVACLLYATHPNAGYVSAILIGFLLGAEFDVLAFLIKRYYGTIAYGRIYGVIFGVFYLGSGIGIYAFGLLHDAYGNYRVALYAAAAVLVLSAILLVLLPPYRFRAGAVEPAAPGAPSPQRV
jgi:MFS family permease